MTTAVIRQVHDLHLCNNAAEQKRNKRVAQFRCRSDLSNLIAN